MVIAAVREGDVYIEEMAVLPAHGRRGLRDPIAGHRLRMGPGGGVPSSDPFYLPRCAVERTVLPKARLSGSAGRGVDARDASDPRPGGRTWPPRRCEGFHAPRSWCHEHPRAAASRLARAPSSRRAASHTVELAIRRDGQVLPRHHWAPSPRDLPRQLWAGRHDPWPARQPGSSRDRRIAGRAAAYAGPR